MKKAKPEPPNNDTPSRRFLKSRWKRVTGFFFTSLADERLSYKKACCLSIEKGGVGVAVGRRLFSQIRIQGSKFYPFPEKEYPTPEFAATCLTLAGAELERAGSPVLLSLPKEWTVLRTVSYPSTVLENPSEAIRFDLDRITPFHPETAYYDFWKLREQGSQVEMVVAAVRMETVDPYLKALREKGFVVEGITINLLGLLSLARLLRKTEAVLLLSLDTDEYAGILYLPRSSIKVFSGPLPNIDPQSMAEGLSRELASLMEGEGPSPELKEVLVLSGSGLRILIDQLGLRLPWPIRWLEEKDLLAIGSGGSPKDPLPFRAIGGLLEGLWPKSLGLNLLLQGRHEKIKTPFVLSALLLLLLAVLTVVYLVTPIELEKKKLKEIEKQILIQKGELKKVEALEKEVEGVYRELSLIRNFKESHPLRLIILKELTVLLPKNTWLTRVRITENQVQLEGYSPSATFLIPRLDSSNYFKKVEFSAPTFRDPRQNMDRFQIKMELEGTDNEKK